MCDLLCHLYAFRKDMFNGVIEQIFFLYLESHMNDIVLHFFLLFPFLGFPANNRRKHERKPMHSSYVEYELAKSFIALRWFSVRNTSECSLSLIVPACRLRINGWHHFAPFFAVDWLLKSYLFVKWGIIYSQQTFFRGICNN